MKRRQDGPPTMAKIKETAPSSRRVCSMSCITASDGGTSSTSSGETSIMKVIVGVRHGEFKRKYNMIVESPTGAPLKYVPLGIQMRRWHGLAVECELAGSVRNAVGYACKVRPTRGGGTG